MNNKSIVKMITMGVAMAFILNSQSLLAWTLSDGAVLHFTSDTVALNVAGNDSCANTGLSQQQILDEAFEAAEQYWNKVPTSRLRFIKGKIKSSDAYSLASGTSDAGEGEILIGCKDEAQFAAIGAAAVGGRTGSFPDGTTSGAWVSIDGSSSTGYGDYSKTVRLGILAHEIGHAIGLGHSEQDSLMYYSIPTTREKLGPDDMAAVSWLYPRRDEALGLAGSCGTLSFINDKDKNKKHSNHPWPLPFVCMLALGFFVTKIASLITSQILKVNHV